MKTRTQAAFALITMAALFLASCGGGGSSAALSALPDEDYYALSGVNYATLFKSEIFEKIADEDDAIEESMENWEDRMDDLGLDDPFANRGMIMVRSSEAGKSVNFTHGPFKVDDLEDYYTDDDGANWGDWEEEETEGHTYYLDDNSKRALFLHAGGYFEGTEDIIEDIIDVLAKGDDRMVNMEEYRESLSLVDMNSGQFFLQFDELDNQINSIINRIKRVEDDDDVIEPLEEIVAIGESVYFTNEIRIVTKIKFEDGEDLQPLIELLEDDMEDIIENGGPLSFTNLRMPQMETDKRDDFIEGYADNTRISGGGNMIIIETRLTWELFEEVID